MEKATSQKPTVLVVDDSPENLSMAASLLKDLYQVKIATDGEKAVKIAFSYEQIDLILLDVMMPGMDGYEVCKKLKTDPKTFYIPVIFMTSKTEVDDVLMGFEVGAVDYITKPIVGPILLARIRTHIRLKKITDILKDKLEDEGLW